MPAKETITTRRLEALTDGIFAFAMTLLVIFIEVPKPHHLNNPAQFQMYVLEQYPQFVSYLITFLLLANFWIIHHHISRFIIKTNYLSLWMNIVFMLFIVLLPFSSLVIGDYPQSWGSVFLFTVNLFFVTGMLLLIWLYASFKRRLINPDISGSRVKSITGQLFIGAFFCLLSILIIFFNTNAALYSYLLIPVFLLLHRLALHRKNS